MQQSDPRITLRLHGEPTCNLGGERRVLEPRAAALLALVAVDGEVTRERAAALLWLESADPRGALRQQLARFRRLVGADLVQGDDRLRLAAGVRTDVTDHCAPGTEGAVATAAPPRPPLLGDLRFPDQPAFDAWLMRWRGRAPSASTESGAAAASQFGQSCPDGRSSPTRRAWTVAAAGAFDVRLAITRFGRCSGLRTTPFGHLAQPALCLELAVLVGPLRAIGVFHAHCVAARLHQPYR